MSPRQALESSLPTSRVLKKLLEAASSANLGVRDYYATLDRTANDYSTVPPLWLEKFTRIISAFKTLAVQYSSPELSVNVQSTGGQNWPGMVVTINNSDGERLLSMRWDIQKSRVIDRLVMSIRVDPESRGEAAVSNVQDVYRLCLRGRVVKLDSNYIEYSLEGLDVDVEQFLEFLIELT